MGIIYKVKDDDKDFDEVTIDNSEYTVNVKIKKDFSQVLDQNKNFLFGKDVTMMIKNIQRSKELYELLMTHGSCELKDNKRDNLANCKIEY